MIIVTIIFRVEPKGNNGGGGLRKKTVILNLALFFLWHVVWPHGGVGADTFSSGLVIAASLMMFRLKAGVIPVLLSCGMLGTVWQLGVSKNRTNEGFFYCFL